jgi:hypothetical protein
LASKLVDKLNSIWNSMAEVWTWLDGKKVNIGAFLTVVAQGGSYLMPQYPIWDSIQKTSDIALGGGFLHKLFKIAKPKAVEPPPQSKGQTL